MKSDVPALVLASIDEQADRMAGLEAGVDDYLPKTFSSQKLLTRLPAVTRRSRIGEDDDKLREWSAGALRLCEETHTVVIRDSLLDLPGSQGQPRHLRMLLIRADGLDGSGMFFDFKPWLWSRLAVLVLSLAFWTPFVWGSPATSAAQQALQTALPQVISQSRCPRGEMTNGATSDRLSSRWRRASII